MSCFFFLFSDGKVYLEKSNLKTNCTKKALEEFPNDVFDLETRRRGAIVLHCFLAFYMFVLLNFVCDDYFVPSIKTLCERLSISKDVAGATFMAAATSSPELFINIIGTFVTKGDLGVGTIVGSAVFNILAVPACCGLLGGQSVKIDWWPLTRDCFVYGLTVVLLIIFLNNGYIAWNEALILVILYFFYITAMYHNDSISNYVKNFWRKRINGRRPYREIKITQESIPLLKYKKVYYGREEQDVGSFVQVNETYSSLFKNEGGMDSESNENCGETIFVIPEGLASKFFFFFSFPISFVLYVTIPDCKRKNKQRLWPITFIMCIVWIAGTSYVVSWMITVVGDTLSIPDSVMGLTFLAAGMSIPEATSSVIVTNQGHGGMGISSSIGSNTFDILLCLGLPWLIKSTFFPAQSGNHLIKINSRGLGYTAISLLTTLTFLYASFFFNRFILDRKIGILCLFMYLTFLIFACLMELNVFFIVNLPPCGS
ncbi:sodium/potassium/calcium exchanger 5 precursor, putative [Pediculus humanus corporis]|uniref:Sodium/potassium/calcium exchanger 5, putative n=1 Tax=Pediculus humanus subsp. corporis TaxID=121224 RepID=E0VRF0_PEDHC|nr:sodium/potassium/calcium exchanger 5 precursor, putative [Pediculus humanus corporis]EEB15956.1 sodium/potassium/calcium exchanger 5 precursor, putative [Pediculus humanus corporis]